jgi:hypothetical protein
MNLTLQGIHLPVVVTGSKAEGRTLHVSFAVRWWSIAGVVAWFAICRRAALCNGVSLWSPALLVAIALGFPGWRRG